MKEISDNEKIKKALYKKALGYVTQETVSEFLDGEEGVKLIKKKVTRKSVPPDVTALKMILDSTVDTPETMSDEELESEKLRLMHLLSVYQNKNE
jgi:hypothetical protein